MGGGENTSPRGRIVRQWAYNNPDGQLDGFTYDILRASHNGVKHSSVEFIRANLRYDSGHLKAAGHRHDVVANQLIMPPHANDLFGDSDRLWGEVDRDIWNAQTQHLLAGPTIWFKPDVSQQWAIRQAAAFAQSELADALGVAVHLIAHSPANIGKRADFHVHLFCTPRTVLHTGLGDFVQALLAPGCQLALSAAWTAWWRAHPKP